MMALIVRLTLVLGTISADLFKLSDEKDRSSADKQEDEEDLIALSLKSID